MSNFITLVIKYKTLLITLAVYLAIFAGGVAAGTWFTEKAYQADISELTLAHTTDQANWEKERTAVAQAQNRALTEAVEKQRRATAESQRVTGELETVKQQLQTTKQELQRSINNATQKDGHGYTGLGANGLRLYRAALGYATDNQCLPTHPSGTDTDASQTGCAEAGLSPDDLLAHAADYGEYCNKLEEQLNAIGRWERNK
ncbi:hypothetical protein [Limnobaculum xujianqingii]|uniref:hypothetical protein n=1 Tax=Limnobaculum xujianqingii TaxID=2738837 RepID=UPI001128284D|nr:hypothetical protein [Limnobaculum xujianqingii]